MPRALTDTEKSTQCRRLLEKGKDAVIGYGVRKVSVDDIAGAAGMAKGTFYQHFESKEQYLRALVEEIHRETFSRAEGMIRGGLSGGGDIRAAARGFLDKLFVMPEMVFFIQNEPDIAMLFAAAPNQETQSFKRMEEKLFEGILPLFGIDVKKVKPGVVHNFVHVLFLMKSSEYMTEDNLQETADLIADALISYIFGGAL